MTIKAIKEKYADYPMKRGYGREAKFNTYTYDDLGKCVVVMVKEYGECGEKYYGVLQLVQVETGKELLGTDRHRNAFTLDDGIDVAYEMYMDKR